MFKLFASALAVIILCATVDRGYASTFDKRIIAIQGSRIDLGGDLEEFSDYLEDIYAYGVTFQFPLSDYFALLAEANRTTIEGSAPEYQISFESTITSISGGIRLQFLPHTVFNPFVSAAYNYAMVDVDVRLANQTYKEDDTENALSFSGGAEISMGDRLSLVGSFTRTSPESRDRDFDIGEAENDTDSIGIVLNAWLTEHLLGSLFFAQELEEDTRTYGLRLGLRF